MEDDARLSETLSEEGWYFEAMAKAVLRDDDSSRSSQALLVEMSSFELKIGKAELAALSTEEENSSRVVLTTAQSCKSAK